MQPSLLWGLPYYMKKRLGIAPRMWYDYKEESISRRGGIPRGIWEE